MQTVNLSDVAKIDTSKQKKTRFDRIKWRLDQLSRLKDSLNTWEADFITSVGYQFTQNGDLSDSQYRTILKIWQDAHEEGLVKLPKGEF